MTEEIASLIVAAAGLAAAVVALWYVKRDAGLMLGVYVGMLVMIPAKLVLPGMGAIGGPATVLGLGLLVWWLSGVCIRAMGFVRGPSLMRAALFVFLGVILVSYAVSALRLRTELEVSGGDRALIGFLSIAGVCLVATDGLRSIEGVRRLLGVFVVFMSLVGIVGIMQFALEFDAVPYLRPPMLVMNDEINAFKGRSEFLRPYSTTQHPIEFAVLEAMTFPIALYFAQRKDTTVPDIVRWAAVGISLLGTFVAVSRSGLLGLAVVGLVLFGGWGLRGKLNAAVGGILFLGVVNVLVPGLIGTLRSLVMAGDSDPSIQGRLEDIMLVRRMLPDVWLHGLGPGTFSKEEYFVLDNELFRTVIELGFPGLFTLAALMGTGIFLGFRLVRGGGDHAALARALTAALCASFACMLTFDALLFRMYAGVTFLFLGVISALHRLALTGEPEPVPDLVDRRVVDAAPSAS